MSLLSNPPHTVTVYPEVRATDWHGNPRERPASTGVQVRGWMQPANAHVDVVEGQQVRVPYQFIARSAPVGPWSRLTWTDDNGNARSFAVVGAPRRSSSSPMTRHITVDLIEER